jgi:hypothetical protein
MSPPTDPAAEAQVAGSTALDTLFNGLDRLLKERSTQRRSKTFKLVVELHFAKCCRSAEK